MPNVVDHRAVEFLNRTTALAPLEILHRVGAMRHRLQRRENMHPRFLQFAGRLPVGGARRGLHQHKRLAALQAAHHVVIHRGITGQRGFVFVAVPHRIAVPGDEIQCLRQLPVVVIVKILHKVGGHRQGGIRRLQRGDFMAAEIGHLGGIKAMPVQIQAVDRHLALRRRRFNLRPVAVGMAPESAPPGLVEILQGLVPRLQPVAKASLAALAMTFAAIFIGNMPAQHRRMRRIALRQQSIDFKGLLTINRR